MRQRANDPIDSIREADLKADLFALGRRQKLVGGQSPAAIVVPAPETASMQWERVDEYVLFSAHQDHDGARDTANRDNIEMARMTTPRRRWRYSRSDVRCNIRTRRHCSGAVPPHRNSPELVEMAHSANAAASKFQISR